MPRLLTVRKPRAREVRQLHAALEQTLSARQRRRAEALLLYATGMEANRIAQTLDSHVNTIYSDLRAFALAGVGCIHEPLYGGAPPRLSERQRARILQLAEISPGEVGLPYGRWSLSKLREYLLEEQLVETISREHLRRVLKKGGSRFAILPVS